VKGLLLWIVRDAGHHAGPLAERDELPRLVVAEDGGTSAEFIRQRQHREGNLLRRWQQLALRRGDDRGEEEECGEFRGTHGITSRTEVTQRCHGGALRATHGSWSAGYASGEDGEWPRDKASATSPERGERRRQSRQRIAVLRRDEAL